MLIKEISRAFSRQLEESVSDWVMSESINFLPFAFDG
jgi:hypothetical protein